MKSLLEVPDRTDARTGETFDAERLKRARDDLFVQRAPEELRPLAPARWDWSAVRRVLVVRLRSIGDTVLATPVLAALRRFLPHAEIDILLEDWVAPVLDGHPDVSRIVTIERGSLAARLRVARKFRQRKYDVAFNLHGGSTATFLTCASGARRRVGFANYRYGFLHTDLAPRAADLWRREQTHSVEQNLALVGWTGVPVSPSIPSRLTPTPEAVRSVDERLRGVGLDGGQMAQPFALVHPAAAFASKQWATANFARAIEYMAARGLAAVALASGDEAAVVETLQREARVSVIAFTDLSLPEVMALAKRARLFVGNDSGIAHIAAAVETPSVVVFGSSNLAHWRPWNPQGKFASEVVRAEMACQPCAGYTCSEFAAPECIRRVPVERVTLAILTVLAESSK